MGWLVCLVSLSAMVRLTSGWFDENSRPCGRRPAHVRQTHVTNLYLMTVPALHVQCSCKFIMNTSAYIMLLYMTKSI